MERDPLGRRCLDELYSGSQSIFIQKGQDDKDKVVAKLHPVGRLDYDSTGLLLFSSSGLLTQTLFHPDYKIEKEYVATVIRRVDEQKLRAKLAAGVQTAEGVYTGILLNVTHMPAEKVMPYLQSVKDEMLEAYIETDLDSRNYLDAIELSTVIVVVREGKHRMVRRILANCGHDVVSLHRTRLGKIKLGELPVGEVRELTSKETVWAQKLLDKGKQKKGMDLNARLQ